MEHTKRYADVEFLGQRFEDAELEAGVWHLGNEETGTVQHIPDSPVIRVLSPLETLPSWRRLAPRPVGGGRGGSGNI